MLSIKGKKTQGVREEARGGRERERETDVIENKYKATQHVHVSFLYFLFQESDTEVSRERPPCVLQSADFKTTTRFFGFF